MEKGFYCRFSVACGEIHEKGHGSAVEIARRKWVRQISERDEGMLNMMMVIHLANRSVAYPAGFIEDIRNLIQNGLEIFRVSRNKLYAQVLLHFVLD